MNRHKWSQFFLLITLVNIICSVILLLNLNNTKYKYCDLVNSSTLTTKSLQEKDFNIIFVETNPNRKYFDFKQLCAIESAAFNNPNAKVNVYHLNNAKTNPTLVKIYPNIAHINYNIEELFDNTIFLEWWKLDKEHILKGPYSMVHIADALRLALLWTMGGIYMDLDFITIKNVSFLLKHPGVGIQQPAYTNNAVLIFPKNHKLLEESMEYFRKNYQRDCWDCNGPRLLDNTIKKYCKTNKIYEELDLDVAKNKVNDSLLDKAGKTVESCDVNIYPKRYFYPINWDNAKVLFEKNSSLLNDKTVFCDSYLIHFWGKMSQQYDVKTGDNSVYEYFAARNCPFMFRDYILNKNKNNL